MAYAPFPFMPRPRGRLDWRQDPLYRQDKRGITPGLARTGLAFNRSLYEPDSATARAVVAPSRPPAMRETWQVPGASSRAALARGMSQYGGRAGYAGVSFGGGPQLVLNPNLPSPAAPAPIPTAAPVATHSVGYIGDDKGPAGPVGEAGASANPNLTEPPAAPSPYLQEKAVDDLLPPLVPNVGSPAVIPDAREEWMKRGGSERTFNRANVARGVRSSIDARATPSRQNSTSSADIRAGWGWNRAGSQDLPY